MTITSQSLVASGLALFNAKPALQVEQTVAQTVTTATATTQTFTTVVTDTHSGYNTGTSTYTVPVAGWFHFSVVTQWAASATGIRFSRLSQNGTPSTLFIAQSVPNASSTSGPVHGMIKLAVADTLLLQIDQNTGGNLATLASGGFNSLLALHWIRS